LLVLRLRRAGAALSVGWKLPEIGPRVMYS